MAEAGTKLTTQQKIERVRRAFDAFGRGDLEFALARFSNILECSWFH